MSDDRSARDYLDQHRRAVGPTPEQREWHDRMLTEKVQQADQEDAGADDYGAGGGVAPRRQPMSCSV